MRKERSVNSTDNPEMSIGRQEFLATLVIAKQEIELLNKIRAEVDPKLAGSIETKMHNCAQYGLGGKRPLSAYYTFLPRTATRQDPSLIIEWGCVGKNDKAKLHDYLNNNINHGQRLREGATILSGHIGRILLPSSENFYEVALLDVLHSKSEIKSTNKEFHITVALLSKGIIPITSDGYPVKLVL